MRCRHCGTENVEDALFCRRCGKKLSRSAGRGWIARAGAAFALFAVAIIGCLVASGTLFDMLDAREHEHGLEVLLGYCNGEAPEVTFAEDGSLSFMQGSLSGVNVSDEVDALAVLDDLEGLLNVRNAEDELVFDKRGSVGEGDVYRFQQCYEGIPVLGKVAILGTDGDGAVRTINADTIDVGHPATEASIKVDDAFAAARRATHESVVSCEGLAYWPLERGVELVWVVICSESICTVSAVSGEVLAVEPASWTMKGVDGVHEGDDRVSFNVEEVAGRYQLVDRERNITYHDAMDLSTKTRIDFKNDEGETLYRYEGKTGKITDLRDHSKYDYVEFTKGMTEAECMLCHIDSNGEHLYEEASCYSERLPDGVPIYDDSDNVWKDSRMLDVVSAINRSYDFFAARDWNGLYGHNHPMHVYLYDYQGGDRTNAQMFLVGYMTVGTQCDTAHGSIEHEYAHAALNGIARLGVYGERSMETKTLHEAYADILSVVIRRDDSWTINGGVRNLQNPEQSTKRHRLSYYEPNHLEADEHDNCTIIGHAAYLMYENGFTWDELADLWCGSIWQLTPTADFDTCRHCVLSTATILRMSDDKQQVIRDAFNAVGIFDHTPEDAMPTNNANVTPYGDSSDHPDNTEAFGIIESSSGKPIARTVQLDFDNDGTLETFVIVGDSIEGQDNAWSHAELWYVDSTGEVTSVAGRETFDLSLRHIDTFGDGSSSYTFISLENTGFGSEGIGHVYTVRGGKPVEVAFDTEGVMWLHGEDGSARGTLSVWGDHHQYQDYLFSYDEASNTMMNMGPVGEAY